MEIYTLYFWTMLFSSEITTESLITGLIIAGGIWLALFVLQGIGLYKMAQNKECKHKWLAFVPFANLIYIGKIAGECDVFGHKMRHAGLYTMIAQIVTTLCCAFVIFSEIYLYMVHGLPSYVPMETGEVLPVWVNLNEPGTTIYMLYRISDYILSIVELIYQILLLILLMGLYRRYNPKNYRIFSILNFFIPLARYVVIFAHRNNKEIDYEAYMRARREAFIRSRQYNPYGPYNPYGNPYGNTTAQEEKKEPEAPFAEFGGEKKSDEQSQESKEETFKGNGFDSFFE